VVLADPAGGLRRAPEGGFDKAAELLVKSDLPGTLVVDRVGGLAVELVDLTPTSCRVLETVGFTNDKETTRTDVTGEMTSYWLRLRFGHW